MDKNKLFKIYCDYLASDDFFIVEHERFLGCNIVSEDELEYLNKEYVEQKDSNLNKYGRELKDFLKNVVFTKRRIVDDMSLINSFRGI